MAKQPFRSGGFGPDATGGSRTGNLLAGLGKFAIDSISGKRNMLLKQVDRANEASMNLAADRIARDEMMKLIPTLQSQNVKRFGRQGMEFQPTYAPPTPKPGSETKGTKGKGGSKPKGKGKTTNTPTTDPDTSTSEMKETGKKSGKTPSGRKPYVTKKEVSDAVQGGHIQEAEGLGLNKAYDAMVARREDNAGKMDTSPKVKTKKTKKPAQDTSSSRVIWGQPQPNMPKGGKARGGKNSNGNGGSTNGNKKGGM
jgi:hypothetical protein